MVLSNIWDIDETKWCEPRFSWGKYHYQNNANIYTCWDMIESIIEIINLIVTAFDQPLHCHDIKTFYNKKYTFLGKYQRKLRIVSFNEQ